MNTVNDSNTFDPARYAAQLADSIAAVQLKIDMADAGNTDEWWKYVLGHMTRLLKTHYARLAVDPIPQPQAKPSDYRPIEATAAPWRSQPPPWRKSPGNVIPDEVKQPGMESERFKLLEWRHNGFESRLQELEKQIESLSAAHESLHNTCWKQSYDVGSRLEALENRAPC